MQYFSDYLKTNASCTLKKWKVPNSVISLLTSRTISQSQYHVPCKITGSSPTTKMFISTSFTDYCMNFCVDVQNVAKQHIAFKSAFLPVGILTTYGFTHYGTENPHGEIWTYFVVLF